MTYEQSKNDRDNAIEPFERPEPFLPIAERSRNGIEPEPTRPIFLPPINDPEVLRVLAVGSKPVVNRFVHLLHRADIAHYAEWTGLIPTPNPGEFMRMLTKRIPLQPDDFTSR